SKWVIARGPATAEPAIPGLKEVGHHTNETVFSLTQAPRRLAVIGGGPIGCELGQAFRRFGSQVSIVGRGKTLLPREDEETAELLRGVFEREGIALRLGAEVERGEQQPGAKVLVVSRSGEREAIRCDEMLGAVVRVTNVEELGLVGASVTFAE